MESGHIYLLKMADGVYKAGRTENLTQRLSSYPRDALIIYIRKCPRESVAETERLVLAGLRTNFTSHNRGAEYFTGNENDMIHTINSIIDGDYAFTQSVTIDKPRLPRSSLQEATIEHARAKKAAADAIRLREKNQKKLDKLLIQVRETFQLVFPNKEIIFQSELDD